MHMSLNAVLSLQSCFILLDCHFCFCIVFVFFFPLKYHIPLDSRANDMLIRAECSCHLQAAFLVWSERTVLGDTLGVVAITITLPLILLGAERLNGQNPWTDWYIGACWRCEEPPTPLPHSSTCHHHYFTVFSPLHPPLPMSSWGDRS